MQKHFISFSTLIIIFCSMIFCLGSCKKNTDILIKRAVRDGSITLSEWTDILDSVKEQKKFKDNEGNFNPELLKDYITDYATNKMRGIDALIFDKDIVFGNQKMISSGVIKVKFYIERSGSMVPFDSKKSKGNFKKALTNLLNSLPENPDGAETMYIVNDAVYDYGQTFREFIKSKNIFDDTKGIGDPRYTDFSCIFDTLLVHTSPDELSIFISDLIYSTKEMAEINPVKILNEAESLTTTVFKQHKDNDVVIIKMQGDFDGKYYPYNTPSKGFVYTGNRPYYIMLVAAPSIMQRIFSEKAYEEFRNFKQLDGFKNFYCFSHSIPVPDYSILLRNSNNKGRYKASKGQPKQIHSIEDFKADRNGERAMTIAVNLNNIIVEENYKTNLDNYEIVSISDYKIEKIIPVESTEETDRYLSGATHLIVLATDEDKIKNESISISLLNKLPDWVDDTDSKDDTNMTDRNFANTTFAFKSLMTGIYKAFFSLAEQPKYFTLNIDVKK